MLKKYLFPAIAVILGVLLLNMWFSSNRMAGNYIAALAEAKVKADAAKAEKARADKYAAENKILSAKLQNTLIDVDNVTYTSKKMQVELSKAHKEILKLKICADREIALSFTLTKCENNLKTITDDYVLQIGRLTLSYDAIVKHKNSEISELVTTNGVCVDRLADMTGRYVKIRASRARRAVIFVGTGIVAGFILSRI